MANLEHLEKSFSLENNEEKRSKLAGDLWEVYFQKATDYSDGGDHDSALTHYHKAIIYCCFLEATIGFHTYSNTGIEYELIEKYDQALQCYEKAFNYTEDPEFTSHEHVVSLLQHMAYCYDNIDQDFKAFRHFQKLFTLDPHYDVGWYLTYRYAKLCYKFREFSNALNYFELALTIIPLERNYYLESALETMGHIHIEKKQFKKAIEYYKKALKVNTGLGHVTSELLLGIAVANFGLEKYSKAIKFAKKALEVPNYDLIVERAYFYISFSYGIKGNRKQESYYKHKLQTFKPDSPYLEDLR